MTCATTHPPDNGTYQLVDANPDDQLCLHLALVGDTQPIFVPASTARRATR
jgi:hypothetical protein